MLPVKLLMTLRVVRILIAATLLVVGPGGGPVPASTLDVPEPAASAGYTVNTFSSGFGSDVVDMQGTKSPSYIWYNWSLFGQRAEPTDYVLNRDGSITLLGSNHRINAQIMSMVKADNKQGFSGMAFGGGAYIEAEMKFDPQDVRQGTKGWPAFWALSFEGHIKGTKQWIGQKPGYLNSVELDFFEYMRIPRRGQSYNAGMHNWYGEYLKTCAPQYFCRESLPHKYSIQNVPDGIRFSDFHRYGFLWVPATKETEGLVCYYFDGEKAGKEFRYTLYEDQPPPPTGKPWAFGVMDRHHYFLILGTGQGQPLTIRNVSVWQRDASNNISNPM